MTGDGSFPHITKACQCVHCFKNFLNRNLVRVAYHLGDDEKLRNEQFYGFEVCTDVSDDVAKKAQDYMTSESNVKKQKTQGTLSLTDMRGADDGIRAKQQIASGAAGTKGKTELKLLADNAVSDFFDGHVSRLLFVVCFSMHN